MKLFIKKAENLPYGLKPRLYGNKWVILALSDSNLYLIDSENKYHNIRYWLNTYRRSGIELSLGFKIQEDLANQIMKGLNAITNS